MLSPYRFASRIGNLGKPLADPFKTFGLHRVHFRRGGTSLIAGAPGSFKSVLALNMLTEWGKEGLDCLYFSADSDEITVVKRLGGILTGDSVETVEHNIMKRETARYEHALKTLRNVEFEYMQMDLDRISVCIKQYESVYGDYPAVIFLDNLINFVDSPDDWGGMLTATRDLDALARQIGAHICILHHAKLPSPNPNKPPPQFRPPADWEIQGKITQIPRLGLTIAAQGMNLRIACVKNTNGPQARDASVSWGFTVTSSMRIQETEFARM
jgi:hypothetical protein